MNRLMMLALLCIGSNVALAQKAQVVSAWNYLKNNELANAKTAIDKAAADETTSGQAKTWAYRGNVYVAIAVDSTKQVDDPNALNEAFQSFQKAAELDTKKEFQEDIVRGLQTVAFIKFNEGVSPYNAQQYEKAYTAFRTVSDVYALLNSKYNLGIVDTSATYYAAYSALRSGKTAEATEGFNRLIAMNYTKPDVYQGLSQVALAQKDTTQALKYIEQGRTAHPDNNVLMYDELNIYLAQNRNQEVITKLEEAVAKNPKSAELVYVLGNKYDLALHDTTNAMKYYNQALAIKPDYFDVHYSAGAMYYNFAVEINKKMNELPMSEQKKYDELKVQRDRMFRRTLPFMEKAYEINPRDRDTLIALKELYARLNITDKQTKISDELKALEGK